MYACGDAAGGQESRVYGTHWPPQESFPGSPDGGRLPALISGRFDLRIFASFTAPSLLTIFALSAPFSSCPPSFTAFLLFAGRKTRCNAPVLLEECFRYTKTMGNTRRRIAHGQELRALLFGGGGGAIMLAIMFIGLFRRIVNTYDPCERNDNSRRSKVIAIYNKIKV